MLLDEDVVYDQYDPVAKLHYRITPKHVKEYDPIVCSTYLSYDSLSRYKQIEKDDTANEISECEKEIYR